MAEPQPTKLVEYEGKQVSYTRAKYLETLKQEAVLRQVNNILIDTASSAVSTGAKLGQQEYGGLLRVVVPQLLDQWGSVNATAAVNFYDNARLLYAQTYGTQANREVSRSSARARANRYATAVTKSAIALNQTSMSDFLARYADDYKTAEKSERVIGYAMKVRAQSGHDPSVDAMNKALTREVASYHHDTILFNSALDPMVERVQRVAQASACEFCRLMALGSTDGKVRVSTYAVKFHDHCHCTIQPLYAGEAPVRPPYYDDFEKQYKEASRDSGSGKTKDILSTWRKQTPGAEKVLPKAAPQAEVPKFNLQSFMDGDKDQRLAAINEVFQGRDFAGFKVEFDSSRGPKETLGIVKGNIIGPDGGDAGTIERWFQKDADGSIFVKHELLSVERRYRGQGFSTEFSKFSEDFYRSIGIKKIKVDAGLEDGAYTWAKAGYTWRAGSDPVGAISKEKIWQLEELGFNDDAARLREIRSVMEEYTLDYENYPQPFELANMTGPEIDDMPFGRWLLHKEYWEGEKKL